MAGWTFGRLEVVARAGIDAHGQVLWRCACSCGGDVTVRGHDLRRGRTESCGCLQPERAAARKLPSIKLHSPEYTIWRGMIGRCENPGNSGFANYGGRGITVCSRWRRGEDGVHPFMCFIIDLGRRPTARHTLERKRNEGGYAPDNCLWATRSRQMRNRRNTPRAMIEGQPVPVADLADAAGLSPALVRRRLRRGWPISLALKP